MAAAEKKLSKSKELLEKAMEQKHKYDIIVCSLPHIHPSIHHVL